MRKLFTSEAVTIGHPDKMADIIADVLLTEYLKKDKEARVAVEVAVSSYGVLIMGEITSKTLIDIQGLVRKTIIEIGYDRDELGFNGNNCQILIWLNKQSKDIALGLSQEELGAGDQGMMIGYATSETNSCMPFVIEYAQKLAKRLVQVRKERILDYLRPDGKVQLTMEYEGEIPVKAKTIVVSAQHEIMIDVKKLREDIQREVINKVIPPKFLDKKTEILINPTGRFVLGGPGADSGLTGRKIEVDRYGSSAPVGGGSFSGKDYTKVDRSASYYARYVCKNIVASGISRRCELQVAYAIGVKEAISLRVETFGTSLISDDQLLRLIKDLFDFRPSAIIQKLKLKEVDYAQATNSFHFGQFASGFEWEKTDMVEVIKKYVKKNFKENKKEN